MSGLEDHFDIRRIKLNQQLMDKYGYKQKQTTEELEEQEQELKNKKEKK